jgi:hypothetical protein
MQHKSNYGASVSGAPVCSHGYQIGVRGQHIANNQPCTDNTQKSHYGAQDAWHCRTHNRPYGECANANTDGTPCAAAPAHVPPENVGQPIDFAGPTGRELPGEHWNARIIRETADASPPPPDLAEIDRNARAYGWEIGHRGISPIEVVGCSEGNPFMDSDWRAAVPHACPTCGQTHGEAATMVDEGQVPCINRWHGSRSQ